jgi:hypothetical protein
MTIRLSQLTDHPSSKGNTPASATESETVSASNNGAGGGEWGGKPERGGVGEVGRELITLMQVFPAGVRH